MNAGEFIDNKDFRNLSKLPTIISVLPSRARFKHHYIALHPLPLPAGIDMDALPRDTPALKPPLGVAPNFEHPSGVHRLYLAILILCLVVCTIFVWMRLYTRKFLNKSVRWDDCTLLNVFCDLMTDLHQTHHSLHGHVASTLNRTKVESLTKSITDRVRWVYRSRSLFTIFRSPSVGCAAW